MLLVGKKLDPQPPSDVTLAPELAHGHGGHCARHGERRKALISHLLPRHGAAVASCFRRAR